MSEPSEPKPSSRGMCFVVCPLGKPKSSARTRSDRLLKRVIEPAAQRCGLDVLRPDQISGPGSITNDIIRHLLKDTIVVADLTGLNPNVFYELGLRHAFNKPVVELILAGQAKRIPFDVQGMRVIPYGIDGRSAAFARDSLVDYMTRALEPDYRPDTPLTAIPIDDVLRQYGTDLEMLESARASGLQRVFSKRGAAIRSFLSAIEEESREIMIIGSSLKGLLMKDECRECGNLLQRKAEQGVRVKILLTHPIVADLRARQETRGYSHIGQEIISALELLKTWNGCICEVRLYLGTPTCFGIKTTRKMLINPYSYTAESYDSPCLILDDSGYFFDSFQSRHFRAWDTELAVPVKSYDEDIADFRASLGAYAATIQHLLSRAKRPKRRHLPPKGSRLP